MSSDVQCNFILRLPSAEKPGAYDLEPIDVEGPNGVGYRTPQPPMVGDTIWLNGPFDDHQGAQYRVLGRNWVETDDGVAVDCLLEPAALAKPTGAAERTIRLARVLMSEFAKQSDRVHFAIREGDFESVVLEDHFDLLKIVGSFLAAVEEGSGA